MSEILCSLFLTRDGIRKDLILHDVFEMAMQQCDSLSRESAAVFKKNEREVRQPGKSVDDSQR